MNKLQQLQQFKKLGIPVPLFREVQWAEDLKATDISWELQFEFPVAVLSSFSTRDLKEKQALQNFFNVEQKQLTEKVAEVFDSYPVVKEERVVVMEMVHPELAGTVQTRPGKASVLEYVGANETGKNWVLLPAFQKGDTWKYMIRKFWKPFSKQHDHYKYTKDFIQLSSYIQHFLKAHPDFAQVPCHFSFSLERGKIYLLEVEKVLPDTSPIRSPIGKMPVRLLGEGAMYQSKWQASYEADLVDKVNEELTKWSPTPLLTYDKGHASLDLEGVQLLKQNWGLSTSLTAIYPTEKDQLRLAYRPFRVLRNVGKWMRLTWHLSRLKRRLKRWLFVVSRQSEYKYKERKPLWVSKPGVAWEDYKADLLDFHTNYVVLKVMLLVKSYLWSRFWENRGLWKPSQAIALSAHNDLAGFYDLWQGKLDQEAFLDKWGHRSLEEEDIAFERFEEYEADAWMRLLFHKNPQVSVQFKQQVHGRFSLKKVLLRSLHRQLELVQWFRDKSIWQLWRYRYELKEIEETWGFPAMPYHPLLPFQGKKTPLVNAYQLEAPLVRKVNKKVGVFKGMGVLEGRVKGRIWRLDALPPKPIPRPDFERVILWVPSLDKRFLPYWLQANAVLVAGGSAWQVEAIQLKQTGLPLVVQLGDLEMQTGDWVELDGVRGEVRILE